MPRLIVVTEGLEDRVFELRLGANRFGRGPKNDFRIDHPTMSAQHCEIFLDGETLTVRDHESTNGTYVDGCQIAESELLAGQVLRMGEVEFSVDNTEVSVEIPRFHVSQAAPPVAREDGSLICPRHPGVTVTHQCSHCHEVLCDACVKHLRRRGGKTLKLCPLCSHPCETIGGEKKKKRTFMDLLRTTVKLPFVHSRRNGD